MNHERDRENVKPEYVKKDMSENPDFRQKQDMEFCEEHRIYFPRGEQCPGGH